MSIKMQNVKAIYLQQQLLSQQKLLTFGSASFL